MYMTAKRLKLLTAVLVCLLGFSFINVGLASADSRPYFRATGGDVFSGGWFYSGAVTCNPGDSTTYQAPNYGNGTNKYKGGIMGFGYNDGRGAGSQFGASSVGLVEGGVVSGEPYGFSTGSSGYNKLTFANPSPPSLSSSNYWGGFLEGTTRQAHCVPDYFGTLRNTNNSGDVSKISDLASNQYYINPPGGSVTTVGSASTLAAGKKITVFVNGSVYINSDIVYGAHTESDTQKFALVVKGSIYIAPTVGRLDGLYIAQPNTAVGNPVTADTGVIWTCHDGTVAVPTGAWVTGNCKTAGANKGKLIFNGAVVAKQLNLLRIDGDVNNSDIAETFNFTPEMVVNGGFFNSSSVSSSKIESILSLPPVF